MAYRPKNMAYRPNNLFSTPLVLLEPTYTTVNGVRVKEFPTADNGKRFFGSFKSYGGTETNVNNVLSVEDTANIETWFRPDIKSDCRVVVANTGATYEIMGEPENVEMRNQFLTFKVKRVKGGA